MQVLIVAVLAWASCVALARRVGPSRWPQTTIEVESFWRISITSDLLNGCATLY